MDWYIKVLKNYATFEGRARRKEYWMFILFNMIFSFSAIILDRTLGLSRSPYYIGTIYWLYYIAILVPSLAVSVRRLHDVGKSGWYLLLSIVPFAGFYLIYLFCVEGDYGSNEYGPDPKYY